MNILFFTQTFPSQMSGTDVLTYWHKPYCSFIELDNLSAVFQRCKNCRFEKHQHQQIHTCTQCACRRTVYEHLNLHRFANCNMKSWCFSFCNFYSFKSIYLTENTDCRFSLLCVEIYKIKSFNSKINFL